MAQLEKLLGRPLSRAICLLHQAELPYRALFKRLDGQTTGPRSFSGPIGRLLSGPVHQLPVCQFPPLTSAELPSLSDDVRRNLSSDLLLMQCAQCVTSGDGSVVAQRVHGNLSMARWHTAQSRLLRVYMAQQSPSAELKTLALYVVGVYLPTVLAIRHRPDLVDAPRHLYQQLERQRRHMTGDDLVEVQKRLCGNAMMAHPEAIVLGMLGDDRREVRARAVQIVSEARQRRQPGLIRAYKCPQINPQANNFMELVDLQSPELDIEPPLTHPFDSEQLARVLDEPLRTGIPNHTQSTERTVKLTTESAAAVIGRDRQDGYSLNKVTFRRRHRASK